MKKSELDLCIFQTQKYFVHFLRNILWRWEVVSAEAEAEAGEWPGASRGWQCTATCSNSYFSIFEKLYLCKTKNVFVSNKKCICAKQNKRMYFSNKLNVYLHRVVPQGTDSSYFAIFEEKKLSLYKSKNVFIQINKCIFQIKKCIFVQGKASRDWQSTPTYFHKKEQLFFWHFGGMKKSIASFCKFSAPSGILPLII